MSTVETSIEVDVPVRTAYDQWTQFEDFPHFMNGVESITQLDDTRLHWKTRIAGVEREFDARITEQHPDERIAWRATGEVEHGGVVTFHRLSPTSCKVMVQIDWQPAGLVEKAGSVVGADDLRVKADLQRFKDFIEERQRATGAWRGDVGQERGQAAVDLRDGGLDLTETGPTEGFDPRMPGPRTGGADRI
jgi:uncharacterized membrane protein